MLNTVNGGATDNLPPVGELIRSPVEIRTRVWAMKTNLFNVWRKGIVTNIKEGTNNEKVYKVRLHSVTYGPKLLPAKHLAYENPASVIIPVGTRVIARYGNSTGWSAHYAGIVAEPPEIKNRKRYLVFFDDGYAQYVKHEDTFVVCAQSIDVADDVHECISEFVRGYLQQYPERPMVKLQVDQFLKIECDFEWTDAKVLEVDCSMVKILFLTSERIEWIYRGSTRLKPLRNELILKEEVVSEGLKILNTVSGGAKDNLPPVGKLIKSPLEIGTRVWAMKTNLFNVWLKGIVTNIREGTNNEKVYQVRLDNAKHLSKPLPAKHLAYENPASVIIPVGTRIIACYTDSTGRSAHYAGIIAEPPKITNRKRYLVFFDDGCAQYVRHEDTYVVCAQSVDVADDVHECISKFVRGYLQQYPERPMVKLQVDQFVKTECDFEWSDAKVLEVDCSMVKILFLASQRIEWIYRGSDRLKPLRNVLVLPSC